MGLFSPQIFQVTDQQLQRFVYSQNLLLPELETARHNRQMLENAPQTQVILQQTQYLTRDIQQAPPPTSYTAYRTFRRTGERNSFEDPYFLKRSRLAGAALRLFFGQSALKDAVQDYIWNICEESNWVVPAHEPRAIDLFAAETGFFLAETLRLLDDSLDEEISNRVRAEIERRIFAPYFHFYQKLDWYQNSNNWNGVCNSSVAATFLLLETNPSRLAQALHIALFGLQRFIEAAFEEDGSSLEGVSYWHYGMSTFVALAELIYARSNGDINLLASEKVKRIAAFPAKLQLSGSNFASFADCDETFRFHFGVIARLAERVEEPSLLNLLIRPARSANDWRLHMLLRDILWWNGSQPETIVPKDELLPAGGIARLVAPTNEGVPVVLAMKAGHNAEPHNHNDVSSFLLHIAGENLLTDPGRGLYSRDYFGAHRYENIFANSYGHSVPRIDGMLQGTGRAFAGNLVDAERIAPLNGYKQVAVEFARAYPCPDLKYARREFVLATQGTEAGTAWLRDHFEFTTPLHEVEEAFLTWLECEISGGTVRIRGQHYDLFLTIEQPGGVQFRLESLEEQSEANKKENILQRLSVLLPRETAVDFSIRMTLNKRG